MKIAFIVFKKELKLALRDKRTLMSVFLIPTVLIPLLMIAAVIVPQKIAEKKNKEKTRVTLINAPEIIAKSYPSQKFEISSDSSTNWKEKTAATDATIVFEDDFEKQVATMQTGKVSIYFNSAEDDIYNKITAPLESYKKQLFDERLDSLHISQTTLTPIKVEKVDIASSKEKIGKLVGGFLPYMFVLFCFMGCMYPAIELTTGEIEKNTMETLLTTPASRFQILIGKTFTMTISGILAASFVIFSLFISIQFVKEIPADLLKTIQEVLNFKFVLLLLGMLIPLNFFFSGVLAMLAMSAKSFKEAQSKIQPMVGMIIFPLVVGALPGVDYNLTTAAIPILNVSLATKEIIADTLNYSHYAITIIVLVVAALAATYFSYKKFSKESVVLG